MFIGTTDIQGKISSDLLTQLLAGDDTIISKAVNFATDTLTNKLGERYNMDTELGKTDDNRDGTLVEYALNLAVFRIFERSQDIDVPERVVKLYDDTLDDLDKLNMGKTSLVNLTKMVDDDGNKKTRFYWGSDDKRDNNPY